jgi:hypothetical protein
MSGGCNVGGSHLGEVFSKLPQLKHVADPMFNDFGKR